MRRVTGTEVTILLTGCGDSLPVHLCEELERAGLGRFPLVWRLPACRMSREALQSRVSRYGDTVCPMGLTGASNVRLRIAEIEAELAWSVSNVWNTGVRDLLHFDPPLVLPRDPDGSRREARAVYGRSPVPVGMLVETGSGCSLRLAAPNDTGGHVLPVLLPSAAVLEAKGRRSLEREAHRRLRAAGHGASAAPLVIAIDLDRPGDEQRVIAIIATIGEAAEEAGWRIVTLEPAGMPRSGLGDEEPEPWFSEALPLPPAVCEKAASLRRRRASRINTRRLLELLAQDPPGGSGSAESRRAAHPGHERALVASMMGDATITGTNVAARFLGGRLCGLAGAVEPALPSEPAESLVRFGDGRVVLASVESCVSFESESSRGVRSESMVREGPHGPLVRIRSEHSFVGDYDALIASHRCLVEGATRNDTLCAVAFPIADHRHCVVTGRFTDGSTYDHHVAWDEPEVLWGEAFQIWDGEARFTIIPVTGDGRPLLWSVSVLRDPSRRLVVGGRYPLGDRAEHCVSFLIMRCEIDDELVVRTLAGRAPAPIVREVAAGVG